MNPCWEDLEERMRKTGGYYLPRLSPRLLSSRIAAKRAVADFDGSYPGRVVRYGAILSGCNNTGWRELALIYIHSEFSYAGALNNLTTRVLGLAPPGTKLFAITRVESVACALFPHGFRAVTADTHPLVNEWAEKVGIAERLPTSALAPTPASFHDTYFRGERTLLMRE